MVGYHGHQEWEGECVDTYLLLTVLATGVGLFVPVFRTQRFSSGSNRRGVTSSLKPAALAIASFAAHRDQ